MRSAQKGANVSTLPVAAATRESESGAAIVTNGLTKAYGKLLAVDHLNLRVQRGEIFGFLGPNGAGKTTSMRMLLGLVKPTSGSAEMLGLNNATDLAAILARTGSIIEEPTFYPYLSGRDNLRMLARVTATPDARIPAILDLVDLTEAARRRFKTYSLGMKQRLAVGAALLTSPELLILDEPANGLDPAGIVEMRTLIRRLKEEGHTVLISSHVLHEIEQVCDRIMILVKGKIVVQGRVHELLGASRRIEVRIERAGEAQAILSRLPWIDEVTRDGNVLRITAPAERSAEINAALAREELYAGEIKSEEQSLEQYFLDVTAGEAR